MTALHTYLKGIAESNTDIAHVDDEHISFKRMRVEELGGNTGLELNSFCMYYYNYEGAITGPNADQLYDRKKVTIVIAKNYERGDFDSLDTVQDECLEVCKQVHAKLIKDYTDGVLTKLNYNIDYYKFSNALDKTAACAFDVDIDFINDITYDSNKWQ
jgi:hypothetical protein